MRYVLVISCLLVLLSCNTSSGTRLGDPVKLSVGQTATFYDEVVNEEFELKFNSVILDARCPDKVLCIIDLFRMEISVNNAVKEIEMPTSTFNQYQAYEVLILSVEPEVEAQPDQGDYEVELTLQYK